MQRKQEIQRFVQAVNVVKGELQYLSEKEIEVLLDNSTQTKQLESTVNNAHYQKMYKLINYQDDQKSKLKLEDNLNNNQQSQTQNSEYFPDVYYSIFAIMVYYGEKFIDYILQHFQAMIKCREAVDSLKAQDINDLIEWRDRAHIYFGKSDRDRDNVEFKVVNAVENINYLKNIYINAFQADHDTPAFGFAIFANSCLGFCKEEIKAKEFNDIEIKHIESLFSCPFFIPLERMTNLKWKALFSLISGSTLIKQIKIPSQYVYDSDISRFSSLIDAVSKSFATRLVLDRFIFSKIDESKWQKMKILFARFKYINFVSCDFNNCQLERVSAICSALIEGERDTLKFSYCDLNGAVRIGNSSTNEKLDTPSWKQFLNVFRAGNFCRIVIVGGIGATLPDFTRWKELFDALKANSNARELSFKWSPFYKTFENSEWLKQFKQMLQANGCNTLDLRWCTISQFLDQQWNCLLDLVKDTGVTRLVLEDMRNEPRSLKFVEELNRILGKNRIRHLLQKDTEGLTGLAAKAVLFFGIKKIGEDIKTIIRKEEKYGKVEFKR